MTKALIVYNPVAGKLKICNDTHYIASTLENSGFYVKLWSTGEHGSAASAARYGAEENYDRIIVVGGDGTLHQVVNGLGPYDYKPCLGIIPYGTTNDFATHFGIPNVVKDAVEVIIKGRTQDIDIAKANDKYILYVAAGGALPSASYQATRAEKRTFGRLAYLFHGAKNILNYKPFHLKITAEELQMEDKVFLFIIGSTSCIGGVRSILPYGDPSDGFFDVLIVKDVDIVKALNVADLILNKKVFDHPKVVTFKTNSIRIESNDRVQLSFDGEAGDFLPINLNVIPKGIQVVVP